MSELDKVTYWALHPADAFRYSVAIMAAIIYASRNYPNNEFNHSIAVSEAIALYEETLQTTNEVSKIIARQEGRLT